MDKKIFEKKMRNKYIMTAVSFLVATLFIGTAMTSAIAGSVVDKSQLSSTSSTTGCPLCASQRNSGELKRSGNNSSFNCTKYLFGVALDISVGMITYIWQNMDWSAIQSAVAKLIQAGYTVEQAMAKIANFAVNWMEDHKEKLRAIGEAIWNTAVSIIKDPAVLNLAMKLGKALILTLTDPISAAIIKFILKTSFKVSIKLSIKLFFASIKDSIKIGELALDILQNLPSFVESTLHEICVLLGLCPPQPQGSGSTGYTESASVPSASQSIMQTVAPSTQQSSVGSSQSSSVVTSPTTVASSTQPSSVSSSQSSASSSQSSSVILSQTIVVPSTQQSTATPVMIGIASILRGQQAINN